MSHSLTQPLAQLPCHHDLGMGQPASQPDAAHLCEMRKTLVGGSLWKSRIALLREAAHQGGEREQWRIWGAVDAGTGC